MIIILILLFFNYYFILVAATNILKYIMQRQVVAHLQMVSEEFGLLRMF